MGTNKTVIYNESALYHIAYLKDFPGDSVGEKKNSPAMWETWVGSLGWEDPLEEGMVTHSNILVWRIPMDRGTWWAAIHGVAQLSD